MNPINLDLLHNAVYENKILFSKDRMIAPPWSQLPKYYESNESFIQLQTSHIKTLHFRMRIPEATPIILHLVEFLHYTNVSFVDLSPTYFNLVIAIHTNQDMCFLTSPSQDQDMCFLTFPKTFSAVVPLTGYQLRIIDGFPT